MASDEELLALIGRAPSQQKQPVAGELLPELDLTSFLSPAAQRELEAAKALKGEPRFPTKTASQAPVLDPVLALITNRVPPSDNPFDGFTFSGQEEGGYVDTIVGEALYEPPPPPPVDMANFNLEDLWSKDATDEIDDGIGGGGRGAPPAAPTGGLEAIFMNREAQEAQEALGLLGAMPPLPPVSRQAREMDISFDGVGDFEMGEFPRRGGGGWGGGGGGSRGNSDGVVVGSRGPDGRFHSVPVPRPRPEVRTASVERASRSDVSRREVYQPPPPRPIEACTSRLAFISGDD